MEKLPISFSFGGAFGPGDTSFEDFKKENEGACAEAAEWLKETPSVTEGHGWMDLPEIDTSEIKKTAEWLIGLYGLTVALIALSFWLAGVGLVAWLGLAVTAAMLAWQIATLDIDDPEESVVTVEVPEDATESTAETADTTAAAPAADAAAPAADAAADNK